MDDLATWLRAQLDARERMALYVLSDYAHHEASWSVPSTGVVDIGDGGIADETILTGDGPLADFIADNDPAFVLADVAAKRQIIVEHGVTDWTAYGQQFCRRCEWDDDEREDAAKGDGLRWVAHPCRTLRLLAQPYAGHPDYQESWKP